MRFKRISKILYIRLRNSLLFRYNKARSTLLGYLLLESIIIGKDVSYQAPVRFSGNGCVAVGDSVKFGYYDAPRLGNGEILIQARDLNSEVIVGRNTAFSNNVSVVARTSITIGEDCLIGDCVRIVDADFHEIQPAFRHKKSGDVAAVVIGQNVWLGSGVTILKGVKIGNNSVIAAGSLVCSDIAENVIAGGVPAKMIRTL